MASGKALDTYRFLVVGKSGAGKSSTANTILGEDKFPTGTGMAAVTKTCEYRKVVKKKYAVGIVDSPGLFDPERGNDEITKEIVKTTAALHPGPHAVLYILKLDRYTPEEFQTFQRLKQMFDENIVKFVIIVFTAGDRMKKEKLSLEEILENSGAKFKQVLEECGHRVIVFNKPDSKKNNEAKVTELLAITDKIYKANGESPYRCTVQETVGDKLEETVTSNVQELIEKDPRLKEFFSQMETKIREKEELADAHQREMEKSFKRKRQIEEIELDRKAEEQRKREEEEEEERRKEEEMQRQEEEDARKEAKRKAKEENERKRQEEKRKLLELRREKMQVEKEAMKEKKEAERILREVEELERGLEAEREKRHGEEMERMKKEVTSGRQTSWVEDIAGGAWKAVKGWLWG